MSSPQPKGPESSSASTDVSETESTAKPHKQDTRRTQQSPFKVPDNNSILLLSVNEKEDHKEEVRKFLALPIHEKTTHTERMTAKQKKESVGEPEEEKEKMENLKQIKSKTTLLKQMPGRHELKMAIIKQANTMKDSKHDLISMEQQKAVLELALMTKKSAIVKMDKAIAKEEWQLKLLEKLIERDNLNFEEFLRENEKKSVEARTLFEQEAKSNQEKNAEIKRLNAEIGTLKRELATSEETLTDYKRYKEILFKLFPPEQQDAQKTKALKVNVQSDRDTQNVKSREPEESPSRNGVLSSPGRELPSIRGTRLSSNPTSTMTPTINLDSESSEYEQEAPELYFTDPQQLLDMLTELTEQNLSLIQNSTRVEETVEELRQSMETTRAEIEKDEEQLALQVNDMKQRVDKEKAKGNKLKQKVQFYVSLNTKEQDVLLDALGEKITEVYHSCVDGGINNLSVMEKLGSIENRVSLLLLSLESIPEESLKMMKKIKDRERRSREREEKSRAQKEKQRERMRIYLERSLADSKRTSGRKLMPRYMPVTQRVTVSNVDNIPAEDELHAYLFDSDDIE